MAQEVGRIDAYKTVYRLQCQLDHNATRSVNEYVKQSQDGIVFEVSRGENWVVHGFIVRHKRSWAVSCSSCTFV